MRLNFRTLLPSDKYWELGGSFYGIFWYSMLNVICTSYLLCEMTLNDFTQWTSELLIGEHNLDGLFREGKGEEGLED
jgi:hypothetical protein